MNMSIHQVRKFLALVPMIAILGGCAALGLGGQEPQSVACPDYSILKNAAALDGEADTKTWRAQIARLAGKCQALDGIVSMDLGVKLEIVRQDPQTELPKDLSFFVAVLDADGMVQTKQTRVVEAKFEPDPLNGDIIDIIELALPQDKSYQIYVGFESGDATSPPLSPPQPQTFNRR